MVDSPRALARPLPVQPTVARGCRCKPAHPCSLRKRNSRLSVFVCYIQGASTVSQQSKMFEPTSYGNGALGCCVAVASACAAAGHRRHCCRQRQRRCTIAVAVAVVVTVMYQLWTHAMTMVIANNSIVMKRKSIISLCRAYNLKHLGGARTVRADKPRSDVVSVAGFVLAPPARRPVFMVSVSLETPIGFLARMFVRPTPRILPLLPASPRGTTLRPYPHQRVWES